MIQFLVGLLVGACTAVFVVALVFAGGDDGNDPEG
jgi:hypothetical protein